MYMLSLSALSIFPFCCLFTSCFFFFFFFNDTATTEIYTLSLHDALPILDDGAVQAFGVILKHQLPIGVHVVVDAAARARSEEHTSELQSLRHLVCRLLLEKKKKRRYRHVKSYCTTDTKNRHTATS